MRVSARDRRFVAGAVLVAAVVAAAGCAGSPPAGAAASSAVVPTGSGYEIVPTPWPHGTVGRYGLRVDPALLTLLPASVGGVHLGESVLDELGPLEDPDLAASAETFAIARAGMTGDADWLAVSLVRLRPESANRPFYRQMAADYDAAACQPAGGVRSSTQSEIADRLVDVTTCAAGVVVYGAELDDRVIVLATEMGSRRLGRQLLAAIP